MLRQQGFSLVELVVVILVLGILAAGTVTYIRHASLGYAGALDRSELASSARLALGRLERELRNALPGSLRANAQCLEFIEVLAAGNHLQLPLGMAATHAISSSFSGDISGMDLRLVVFPQQPAAVYGLANPGPVSSVVSLAAPDAEGRVQVDFAAGHAFAEPSPTGRAFLIQQPVSYCVQGGRLWRYGDYGFLAAQPMPADLPATLPQRGLIGTGLLLEAPPFRVEEAGLTRNAVVVIELLFAAGDDRLQTRHRVQVRNVP